MVVSAFIFETRGGAIVAEFEPKTASWNWTGNDPETADATIDLRSPVEEARGWRNIASPWSHCLALEAGGRYIGGPILPHNFDDTAGTLRLTARGLRTALAKRNVMPLAALQQGLVDANGVPRTSLDTVVINVDYGTIGKRVVQQALTWPSWTEVPVDFHPDRPGKRFQVYSAVDRIKVDRALTDLSALENGPDIRLELQKAGDTFRWLYRSGTEEQPRLATGETFEWEIGKANGLRVLTNPMQMASVAWSIGGRSEDRIIEEHLYDPRIVELGGLLLEADTKAPANEADRLELRRWNAELLRTSQGPWDFWTFTVPADESPYPVEYSPGDLVRVKVLEDTPVAGGYIPAGDYERRIAGLRGDHRGTEVEITCGENYG